MKFEQMSQFHQPNGTKRKATFAHGKKDANICVDITIYAEGVTILSTY